MQSCFSFMTSSSSLKSTTLSSPQSDTSNQDEQGQNSFMKQLQMFKKTVVPTESAKKSVGSPLVPKQRHHTDESEKEESPVKVNLSTDGGSSKKKVGFNLKTSMSEAKTKDLSPRHAQGRNCLGFLFPLSSSNSPKYSSQNSDKPDLPYRFYSDGSYELKEELKLLLQNIQAEDAKQVKELVDSLLVEYEPVMNVSATLKELIEEIKQTPDSELRLLIEDKTETILEGRSPIRKKNYLSDFKGKLKEGVMIISQELSDRLQSEVKELLQNQDCLLKEETLQALTQKSCNIVVLMRNFIEKIEIYEYVAIYLQDFREEIRRILSEAQKGSDPELYNEFERASRSSKIEEYIEYIFKLQQILLRVDKPSRVPSELRTNLEMQIRNGYFTAFRIDFKKFLLINKSDSNNITLYKALSELLDSLPFEKSDCLLKEVEVLLQDIKKKGHSELWPKAQLLLLRCNMILYRLHLQNLLKRVPDNEFNQLNFLIMERLYEKSLEDSPEIYPEVSEILEKNPRLGTQRFKQGLSELAEQFQINKIKKEVVSNKPILKSKPLNNSPFLPLSLLDNESMLNESNLDISMSPSDTTELLGFKEISPKILILESSKSKSVSKEDYLNIWENSFKNRQFHDEIFLNNFSSLCFSSSKPAFPDWKGMKWSRISEIFKGRKPSLTKNIRSSLIKKTNETPLYLYNALLAISDHDFIFSRNFEDQSLNDKGLYFVKICQDGIWRYIILDDFLPVWLDKKGYRCAFLDLLEYDKGCFDIWPLLILKALAKIYTTYQSVITSGCFYHTIRDLTGAPVTALPIREKFSTSKILKEYYEKGLILLVGGKDGAIEPQVKYSNSQNKEEVKAEPQTPVMTTGLQKTPPLDLDYVYHIVGVATTKTDTFLEISSPMLELEKVPEPFLKKSEIISAKIKEINSEEFLSLNTEKSLFMDYEDFTEFFPDVLVCHLYPDYFYVARTITHVKNTYCIRTFSLQNSSHCFLEVSQVDKRYFRGLDYDYSPVRILVGKVEGQLSPNRPVLKYIGGIYRQARNVNLELQLEKGCYWVLVSFDWRKNTYDATLNYYGQEKILLEKVSYNVNRSLMEDFGGLIAKNFGQKIKMQGEKVVLYFYASTYDCLIVEHLVNNLPNKSLYITRDYSFLDSSKIQLLGKYNKMTKIEVKVESGRSETILFRVIGVESLEILHSMLETKFLNDYKNLKVK